VRAHQIIFAGAQLNARKADESARNSRSVRNRRRQAKTRLVVATRCVLIALPKGEHSGVIPCGCASPMLIRRIREPESLGKELPTCIDAPLPAPEGRHLIGEA
jgi:hypothetical protein